MKRAGTKDSLEKGEKKGCSPGLPGKKAPKKRGEVFLVDTTTFKELGRGGATTKFEKGKGKSNRQTKKPEPAKIPPWPCDLTLVVKNRTWRRRNQNDDRRTFKYQRQKKQRESRCKTRGLRRVSKKENGGSLRWGGKTKTRLLNNPIPQEQVPPDGTSLPGPPLGKD